ncbi:MAG TPA: phosphoribosylglycinamide formyltransferase [Bdellovibrionales bacterium]|nr:phosphoribosylglycinamide formyltransferase [Bdellovibrionales bacterium]
MKSRLVVCASGEGTTFESIVKATRDGRLEADVVGLIVNRPKIGALGRAARLNVPTKILSAKSFTNRMRWDEALLEQLQEWRADYVVLAGFLALIGAKTLKAFPQKIVNSHPALLPKHGGHGMYGIKVHEAVIAARESESGVTIHLIDERYDRGKILAQTKVSVPGDADALEAAVKRVESEFYPRVLNDLVTGRITTG